MATNPAQRSLAIVKASLKHLESLHEAYKDGLEVRTIDYQPFYDSLSDDFVFITRTTVSPHDGDYSRPPWSVVGKEQGKVEMMEAWSGGKGQVDVKEVGQGSLVKWEVGAPLEYFSNAEGTRVVVLLQERYSGFSEWNYGAMVFNVHNGLITRYEHLADMSGYLVETGYLTIA